MQLSRSITRHSRRCALEVFERSSKGGCIPTACQGSVDRTTTPAVRQGKPIVTATRPSSSAELQATAEDASDTPRDGTVNTKAVNARFSSTPNEADVNIAKQRTLRNGRGDASDATGPAKDATAAKPLDRRQVRSILDVYAKFARTPRLPSLTTFAKYSDELNIVHPRDHGEESSVTASELGKVPVDGVDGVDGNECRAVTKNLVGDDRDLLLAKLLIGMQRRTARRRLYRMRSKDGGQVSNDGNDVDGEHDRCRSLFASGSGLAALADYKMIKDLGAYPPWGMCSLLVEQLAGEGLLDEAEATFADIRAHGVLPTEACATVMIRLLVENGKVDEAMTVIASMEGTQHRNTVWRPRFRSYQPVIRELFRQGDMHGVTQLWKHMQWHNVLPKESFFLDLIADLDNSPEDANAEDLIRHADTFLDGVSKTLIYPSAPTVTALLDGWKAKWTDVSEKGTCTACGERLQKVGLRPEDRAKMRSSIVHIAAQNSAAEVQRLSWFANWYDSLEEPPTAIIDGPNAALMNQNYESGGFTLRQVDWLADHLQSMGERVLIIMPWYHCKPGAQDKRRKGTQGRTSGGVRTAEQQGIIQKWIDNDWLAMVEGLDDLYWMYSTVARDDVNAMVVTNDLMRDHRNFFPEARDFIRWKRSHMVSFSFGSGTSKSFHVGSDEEATEEIRPEVKLVSGVSWGEVQRTGDNWHLPVRISENKPRGNHKSVPQAGLGETSISETMTDTIDPAKSWICVPLPASLSNISRSAAASKGARRERNA